MLEEEHSFAAKVEKALSARGVRTDCPMCGHNQWFVAAGFMQNILTGEPSIHNLNNNILPAITIVCKKCGFISQHASKVLDVRMEGSKDA